MPTETWVTLVTYSMTAGVLAGLLLTGWKAVIVGGAIPWLSLLAFLLYNEYFVPYEGGGASMWPVAQIYSGTIGAAIGAVTAGAVRYLRASRSRP